MRTAEKEDFESLIDKYYKKKLNRADPVYIGKAEESSAKLINSSAPLIMGKANLDKSTRNIGNNKNYSAHGMDERFVRSLPARINSSVLAYTENRNGVNSFTYIVFNEFTGKLTAIGGERNVIYEGRTVNRILSMFDIGTLQAFLTKEGKDLKAFDKNEVKKLLKKAQIQTLGLQEILDHMQTIPQSASESKGEPQHSARNNLGYHAGDLGKAEHLRIQGRSRGTGHFGTGTYFAGEEEKVTKDRHYGKRPQHAVNFSEYHLFRVRSDREGYRLHDALRIIDGGVRREWIVPAANHEFNASDPTGYYKLAQEKCGDDWTRGDNLLNSMLEFAEQNGIKLTRLRCGAGFSAPGVKRNRP